MNQNKCPNCVDGHVTVQGDGCLWCDRCEFNRAVDVKPGLPAADTVGGYWWFKPDSSITPEPQALFVRWMRGAVRAVYGGQLVRVAYMAGKWVGPIPVPTEWDEPNQSEVFRKPECVFNYCPTEEICKVSGCQSKTSCV